MLLSRVSHSRACSPQSILRFKQPPLRSLPLRRLPGTRQLLIPRLPTLEYCALSAFLTLSGPYSTRYLPALFHAGTALGVLPSRVHPTRGAARPLGRRCPHVLTQLLVTAPSHRLPSPSRGMDSSSYGMFVDAAPWETGHTSGPCSPRMSVPLVGGLDQTTGRDPHGLFPS